MTTVVEESALVLLCGTSFAGKSTLSRLIAGELGAKVVSLDAINEERQLHGGQGIPTSEWALTNDEANRDAISR